MSTNERRRLKTTDTTDSDATETHRLAETRSLLAQALTRLDEDRQAAIDDLAAATRRLGGDHDHHWPEEHPAGRALELTNAALDAAMVDKRDQAQYAIRQALQLLIAAEREVIAE